MNDVMTSLCITRELFISCEKICFIRKIAFYNWKGYYFNFFAIKRVKYFFLMESCIFLLIDIDYKKIIKSFIT